MTEPIVYSIEIRHNHEHPIALDIQIDKRIKSDFELISVAQVLKEELDKILERRK